MTQLRQNRDGILVVFNPETGEYLSRSIKGLMEWKIAQLPAFTDNTSVVYQGTLLECLAKFNLLHSYT